MNKSKKACSNNIDGVTGDRICNVFKHKYESLYGRSEPGSLSSTLERCHERISADCLTDHNTENHLHDITSQMVCCAIKN